MDGNGVPTGPEWIFFFNVGDGYPINTSIFGNSWGSYFYSNYDATWVYNTTAYLAVHYNPTGGTTTPYKTGFIDANNLSNNNYSTLLLNNTPAAYTTGETLLLELNSGGWATATYLGKNVKYGGYLINKIYVDNLSNNDLKLNGIVKDQATETKTCNIINFNAPFDYWPCYYHGDFVDQSLLPGSYRPYDAANFFPSSTEIRGMILGNAVLYSNSNRHFLSYIVNWDKPYIALYYGLDGVFYYNSATILGKIIKTMVGGGNPNSMMCFQLYNDYNYAGRIDAYLIQSKYDTWGGGGTLVNFTRTETGKYTWRWGSKRFIDKKFYFSPIQIYNSNEIKGWIDPDVMVEGGAYSYDYQRIFKTDTGNPLIKLSQQYLFPWAENTQLPLPPPYDKYGYSDEGGLLDDFDLY